MSEQRDSMNRFGASLAGLLAVIIWAAIPSLVKSGVGPDNVFQILVLRFALGSLLFLPVVPSLLRKAGQIAPWRFLFLALILGANYYFQTVAMRGIPASWCVVIFSLNPILSLLALKVRGSRQLYAAIVFSFVGTLAFVCGGGLSEGLHSLLRGWTFFAMVIGMFTWVLYTHQISRFQMVFTDVEATALTQILALFALTLLWASANFEGQSLSGLAWGPVLALGWATPAAYFGFNYCLRRNSAFCVLSQYLEPVFGVGLGMMLFHEQLTLWQGLGAAAIVFGTARLGNK